MSASAGGEPVDGVSILASARSQHKSFARLVALALSSSRLVWRSGRGLFLALVALQVAAGLAMAGQVLVVRTLLDAILRIGEDRNSVAEIWGPVLFLAGLTAVSSIFSAVQGHLQRLLGEQLTRVMWSQILDVATSVDLARFESSDFFNRLQRVQMNALSRPYQVTQGLMAAGGALVSSIGVGAALVSISPLLLPLIVVTGLPVLLTSRRESLLEFRFAVDQTPNQQLRQYLALVQTGRDEAKEVRAFGLVRWLRERYDDVYSVYLADLRAHVRRRAVWSILGSLGTAIALLLTFVVLVQLIASGQVTVAGAGAAIVATRLLASQIQTLFGGVQRVFESGLFLDDLEAFMGLAPSGVPQAAGRRVPSEFSRVDANNLTFTYPGAQTAALRGVSVSVGAGEVIAIVGENGSGKTTLAKVLAGLYDPDEGAIHWDGVDIRTWDREKLRSRISVIFQDFVRYAFSAEDNIAVGDVSGPVDSARVHGAARAAGAEATLAGLPRGFATVLSRLFMGGSDLSGGEWQRVAMARSYYRGAPLVILDEPSAALDPRAENDLFASLRTTLQGRSAVFISHRFSTVRSADRVYVMDHGQVIECGTHDELMRLGGRYAELFRLQASAFLADVDADGL